MKTDTPQTIYLKDYATLALRRNPAIAAQPLILDGEELETLSVAVDGEKVLFSAQIRPVDHRHHAETDR